jgi:hypothetical protein
MTGPRRLPAFAPIAAAAAVVLALTVHAASQGAAVVAAPTADRVIAAYVEAIGGQAAIDAVQTRTTRGLFDNGRALVQPFVVYAKPPDRIVTIVGRSKPEEPRASARGFDGVAGWDKNLIGTGLRTVTGAELADMRRTADLFRVVHLPQLCTALSVDDRGSSRARMHVVHCTLPERAEDWFFDANTGLVVRSVSVATASGFRVATSFEDYRLADGLKVPFRTRIESAEAAPVTFAASSVVHNEPIDDAVFKRPLK